MKKVIIMVILAVALLFSASCGTNDPEQGSEADRNVAEDDDGVWDGGIDWSLYPIIIDGRIGVPENFHTAPGSDFPTHVPLMPILAALEISAVVDSGSVSLAGLLGEITFEVGSANFILGDETITLAYEAISLDGQIFVPILFFRDVYGMGFAGWLSGAVHLNMQADDMY